MWPATQQPPKGVVCYFNGYGSYVGQASYQAKYYAEHGYDFVGMDYRGYGKSEGQRYLIPSKDGLYNDCAHFVLKTKQFYQERFPGNTLPFVTFGYSLGGIVSLGVSRKLKEAGEKPLDAQIYVVPAF